MNLNERVKLYPECYSEQEINEGLAQPGGVLERKIDPSEDAVILGRMCQMFCRDLPHKIVLLLDFRKESEIRREENNKLSIIDLLGCYRRTGEIVLFIGVIASVAAELSCDPIALGQVVFIHEFAHWLDFDGKGEKDEDDCTKWNETLAQLVTLKIIEDKKLISLISIFKLLSEHQTDEYRTWKHFENCSIEDFSTYLCWLKGRKVLHDRPKFYKTYKSCFDLPELEHPEGASQYHEAELPDEPELE